MKLSILLATVLIIAFWTAPVQSQAGSLGNFCTYYSGVLKVTNNALVTSVVTGVFGLIVPGPLVIYFNGTKANSLAGFSFLNNVTAYNNLFAHVVSFFGLVLNCTDGTIPPYTFMTMTAAHATLNINYFAFALFDQYVLTVMAGAGVNAADVTLVAGALNGLNTQTCFAADCQTICNKYSIQGVLNNTALVSTVVVKTFMAAAGSPLLLPFFNGSIVYPGVQNYLTNMTAQTILVAHLVQFFGIALGCSDGSIGAYQGQTLTLSHSFLPINNLAFTTFNAALVGVLASLGVTAADQTAVAAVLEGTRSQVCFQADCVLGTNPTSVPPTTKAASASTYAPTLAVLAGAAAALF